MPEHAHRLVGLLPHGRLVEIDDSHTLISLDQPDRLAAEIHSLAWRRESDAGALEAARPECSALSQA